jgi:hypothetical protein
VTAEALVRPRPGAFLPDEGFGLDMACRCRVTSRPFYCNVKDHCLPHELREVNCKVNGSILGRKGWVHSQGFSAESRWTGSGAIARLKSLPYSWRKPGTDWPVFAAIEISPELLWLWSKRWLEPVERVFQKCSLAISISFLLLCCIHPSGDHPVTNPVFRHVNERRMAWCWLGSIRKSKETCGWHTVAMYAARALWVIYWYVAITWLSTTRGVRGRRVGFIRKGVRGWGPTHDSWARRHARLGADGLDVI